MKQKFNSPLDMKSASMLTVQLNEEYAMKDEDERLKACCTAKEIFSCAMVSPAMKNFYKFDELVAQSNVKFSKRDHK